MADGVIFRTVDMGRWGAAGGLGTGGNLTSLQFDENMWELLTRIQALENDPPVAISVSGFTVIGSQFVVNMSDASTRGPYDLPIATFRLQGEWTNSIPLAKLDIISAEHFGLFLVLLPHTTPAGPATFDPLATDPVAGPTFGQPLYQILFGEDTYIYDVGFFFPGKPGIGIETSQAMASHLFLKAVVLPTALPNSRAKLRVGPSDLTIFPIKINGVTQGTLSFALGVTTGVFSWTADIAIAAGDVLTIAAPFPVDDDARDLTVSFEATRVFA